MQANQLGCSWYCRRASYQQEEAECLQYPRESNSGVELCHGYRVQYREHWGGRFDRRQASPCLGSPVASYQGTSL